MFYAVHPKNPLFETTLRILARLVGKKATLVAFFLQNGYNYSKIMAVIILLLLYFLVFFAGFAVGRIGHIMGGYLDGPDHWIYGVVLFAPGIWHTAPWIFLLFAFGTGLIISDFKDLLNLKFWGPDKVEVLRFWHID